METGNWLVMVICILILAIFIMSIVEMTIPLFKKIKLNSISERYMSIMEYNSGLTADERTQLINELTDNGFLNVSVNCTLVNTLKYGEKAFLDIDTTYDYQSFSLFDSTTQSLEIDFYDDFIKLRIEE